MRHHNSVFHDLLKRIPWHVFDALVEQHQADKHVRRLSTKSQFVALLYGQLAGAASLREIEAGLESHEARLYHLGARRVSRSTLADANAKRSYAVFAGVFAALAGQAHRGLRRALDEAVYLIDATSLPLGGQGADWAHFSATTCGAKAHVIYDASHQYPVYVEVSAANVNDITAAKAMPVEAGASYVFDLGYYDYGWWASLDKAGCRIVTRFKTNTPLQVTCELDVKEGSDILSDRIGLLPRRQARNRQNPFGDPVREIRVRTETGKVLRILSNDLDAPAQEIAALYKRRWEIELFFKWIKQILKIRHCLGRSQNAVRIQILVALIAYLILRLAHASQNSVKTLRAFTRLISTNIMHKKRTDALLKPEPPPDINPLQGTFQWI